MNWWYRCFRFSLIPLFLSYSIWFSGAIPIILWFSIWRMTAVKLFSEADLWSFCWLICFLIIEGNSRSPAMERQGLPYRASCLVNVIQAFAPSPRVACIGYLCYLWTEDGEIISRSFALLGTVLIALEQTKCVLLRMCFGYGSCEIARPICSAKLESKE
jgi:hypothetical protein